MKKPRRVAIYARISTQEGRQHLDNQLIECRRFIDNQPNWEPGPAAVPYVEEASGADSDRPTLRALMCAADNREFDIVIAFDLSRLTREGPARAFEYIARLRAAGVEFWSVREPYFRTSGIAGDLLIALAAYFYEEERRAIRERVKAGVERARRAGRKLGRPTEFVDAVKLEGILGRDPRPPLRAIAAELQLSKSTVERHLRKIRAAPCKRGCVEDHIHGDYL
jgi:DNA invertase Pin-like site-specific DNA recombinase